ncbi:hypothetical protein V6N13_075242 [Hibiscus sabdariffa]
MRIWQEIVADELDSCRNIYGAGTYDNMYLVNCTMSIKSSQYVGASRCSDTSSGHDPPSSYLYFLSKRMMPRDFSPFCTVIAHVPVMFYDITGMTTLEIYENLSMGFGLSWRDYNDSRCSFDHNHSM